MGTGKVLWSVQDVENDAWLTGCGRQATENCPKDLGPDFDFGASPMLRTLPDGRRVLLAGQKSGQVFAHDPDRQGALVWKALLVDTVGAAEILFGGAADEQTAYFGLDNGVLAALDPATGQQKWSLPARVVPAEGPRRGFTAALTAIPGVLFAGGQDGTLRAFLSDTGREVWTFDMLREFGTVNDVAAKGGSMGAPGPTVAGGMLFAGSGYVGLGNGTPGNVLLAFGSP
jgi:polyvinyl alcohol dehydrogenase (cytochrome)